MKLDYCKMEPLTEDYFFSIELNSATIDDVARARVMLNSSDAAVRQLAEKYYGMVTRKYFPGMKVVSYFIGHHIPWAICLRTKGSLDYEYPVEIASLVDARWEILVNECAAAMSEASKTLKGNEKDIICQRLFAQVHTLFSSIEGVVGQPDSQQVHDRLGSVLDYAEHRIAELSQSIRDLALKKDRRVAQQWYLLGMLPGLLIVGALVIVISRFPHILSRSNIEITIAAGGLGALLSVLGRTTSARFSENLFVDTQAGSPLIISAGAFRPIVGSLLAFAFYILIESGLLPIKIPSGPQSYFFISAISILAGFSERLAQDALVRTSHRALGTGHVETEDKS